MYLTVHAPSSLIIGSQINQPLLAFIFAFVWHLVLDAIPHDSQELSKWARESWVKKTFFIACLDFLVLFLFLGILWWQQKINFNASTCWAIIGGVLPDILWGIDDLLKNKFKPLAKFHYFHSRVIHALIKKDFLIPLKHSVLIQSLVFFITLIIYLKIF